MVEFERSCDKKGVLIILIGTSIPRGYITARGKVVWEKHALDEEMQPEDLVVIGNKCGEVVIALSKFDKE